MKIKLTLDMLKAKDKYEKRMKYIDSVRKGKLYSKNRRYNNNSGFNSIIRGLKQAKEHMDNNKK